MDVDRAICDLPGFLIQWIEIIIISNILGLGESNEGEWIRRVKKLGDEGRRCQVDARIALHVHQISHRVDGILQATLSEWMIPV